MRFISSFCKPEFVIAGVLSILTSCANPPIVKEVTQEERVKRDQVLGKGLAPQFESQLKFKKDTEVSMFLRTIAERFVETTPELSGSPVGIWLIQNTKGKWASFSLPGNRIYLPTGVLRNLEFENEVASTIAFQFGHLLKKSVQKRIKEISESEKPGKESVTQEDSNLDGLFLLEPEDVPSKMDYFGPDGIFAFSDETEIGAMKSAIGILYRAGYDARGLISLWTLCQSNPEYSPYEKSTLNKLMESTRQEIAFYAPLRNPIVRSQRFMLIQKRIKKL